MLPAVVRMQRADFQPLREIAKSATLVMLGNLGSSIMGMVRQIVVAALGTSIAGPFNSALLPAQTFNDFLVNGSVPGALIPTFNDYSAPEKRDELRRRPVRHHPCPPGAGAPHAPLHAHAFGPRTLPGRRR